MNRGFPRATAWRWAGVVACLVGAGGCGRVDPLGEAGVSLRVPDGWRPVARTTWSVPGTPLAAWSGPGGASLVVYRALPVPKGDAAGFSEGLKNRLENLPGFRVVRADTERVAGSVASRVEVVAAGTGAALAPTGRGAAVEEPGRPLRPTRQVAVTLLRPSDTLALVWHAPEAGSAALAGQVGATLESLAVRRARLATQSY